MPQRNKANVTIFVDGQPLPDAQPLMIHRSIGAGQLDVCEFELPATSVLIGASLGARTNHEIEVVLQNPQGGQVFGFGGGGQQVLHWGRLTIASLTTDGKIRYTSRMEPFHFGEPLRGMLEWNPLQGQQAPQQSGGGRKGFGKPPDPPPTLVRNDMPLIFNPRIDGVLTFNRRPRNGDFAASTFIDPESIRTDVSQELQQLDAGEASKWTLVLAVQYLCAALNVDETNILNPTDAELELFYEDSKDVPFDNFHVPNGIFLNQALDHLLTSFGYCWNIEYQGIGKRKIVIKKRGEGQQRFLYLQAPGSQLDTKLTNTEHFQIDFNVGSATNRIDVLGSFREVEAEFDLVPAWDKSLDDLDEAKLTRGQPEYEDNPTYQRVYRDFVLNEAGDYIGKRDSITKHFDFSSLFNGPVVPRRRKFHPTITQADDLSPVGELTGVHVRYSIDNGTTYEPLETMRYGAVHLLERECGIRFAGESPPQEFVSTGQATTSGVDKIKIKVTATVRDDQRIATSYSNLADSPLGVVHPMQLDAPHRFSYRQLDKGSFYYADVQKKLRKSAQADDSDAIDAFAQSLRDAWDMADVSGRATIADIDGAAYELGDVLTGIQGRAIDFSCRPPGSSNPRYPQIVGIAYDFQKQKRTLILQTMRAEHLTRTLR